MTSFKFDNGISPPPTPITKTGIRKVVEVRNELFPDSPSVETVKTKEGRITLKLPPKMKLFPDSPSERFVPNNEPRNLVIAMPYYKNGGMLKRHQEEWANYPDDIRKNMTVIIADDGSPTNRAIDSVVDCDYDLQIYQIKVDLPWNQTGARNLAMHNAPEGWILVTDIDHVLKAKDAASLMELRVDPAYFYVPSRRLSTGAAYKPHPNTYYLTKQQYWHIGGCDEDFQGWYGSDATFRRALNEEFTRVDLPNIHLYLYGRKDIADASTVDFGRKDSQFHVSHNYVLSQKKKAKIIEKPINPLRFEWERVR